MHARDLRETRTDGGQGGLGEPQWSDLLHTPVGSRPLATDTDHEDAEEEEEGEDYDADEDDGLAPAFHPFVDPDKPWERK